MHADANTADTALLDPEFIQRIERLEIVSRKIFQGKMRGERRSKRRGESAEFADYRNYVVGDDLRFLDWNIYARLDRLFLKLFHEEEDLHVNVLLDVSASMDWGKPQKSRYARQVAASLGYIGLASNDRVSLYAYANGVTTSLAGLRGKQQLPKMLTFLTQLPCGGVSHLENTVRQFVQRHPQPGILLVVSDFLDKGGFEAGLRLLAGRKFDIYAVQILSPEEIDPPLNGELRLVDVEDDDVAEVTISRALLDRYKQRLAAYCRTLRDFCTRRGMTYAFSSTATPFDQIVFDPLAQARVAEMNVHRIPRRRVVSDK